MSKNKPKSSGAPAAVSLEDFKHSSSDTGSSDVQIARLTKRLNDLTQHFKTHKKDFHSQTGLIKIINKRKSLLSYLKNKNFKRYQTVVQKLGLRK